MSNLKCVVCTAKTDSYLCVTCTNELEKALAEMPALLHDLDTTISRQDRGTSTPLYAMKRQRLQIPGEHYPEGSTTLISTPWEFSWDAANLRWTVRNTLVTWARHLAETRGAEIPKGMSAAMFLLEHIDSIRLDEAAYEIHDQISWSVAAINRAIDRQGPDVFAGRCDATQLTFTLDGEHLVTEAATCGVDLYGRDDEPEIQCGACGMKYQLAERLAEMVDRQINDQLARAHLIADALTTVEATLTRECLRKWIQRDAQSVLRDPVIEGPACGACKHSTCKLIRRRLILRRDTDSDGHGLYRVGDVRERLRLVTEQRETGRMTA